MLYEKKKGFTNKNEKKVQIFFLADCSFRWVLHECHYDVCNCHPHAHGHGQTVACEEIFLWHSEPSATAVATFGLERVLEAGARLLRKLREKTA